MFVRIARFEGGTAEGIDRRVEAIKANMAEGARDGMPAGMEKVKGVLVLVDRDNGRMTNLVFCDTRADLEAADAALDQMTPGEEGGRRSSVEMYETAIEETMAGLGLGVHGGS
jgi:hypothetical protein